MSYLNSLRLHFFGQFQAAVSTVNNNPEHFNNKTFLPEYQTRGPGGWNPQGDGSFRLIGCGITAAWRADGSAAADSDPVLQCSIADSDLTVPAKMVDLDPHQKMVTEIWGLQVRIADSEGQTLMRGTFQPAAFSDIWHRWPSGSGQQSAGAAYQSVLTNLEWGDVAGSPFLEELRTASESGLLSIKFNVDAFDGDFESPTFTLGRIAGTIGPATTAEPDHFVLGRQFMAPGVPGPGPFFTPAGGVNFCVAWVDHEAGKILLDVGNALPTQTRGGPFLDSGRLSLQYTDVSDGQPYAGFLGFVDYQSPNWYQQTAGVVALPSGRRLTKSELKAIAGNRLVLMFTDKDWKSTLPIWESPDGHYVRADRFVHRLDPEESAHIPIYATKFGQPYANATVVNFLDQRKLASSPAGGIEFPVSLITNAAGRATLIVKAHDPANPRGPLDGQLYALRPALADTLPPTLQYPFNPGEFISFLVWDEFEAKTPVWDNCLEHVFQQYANLYPVMGRFLDMSSYESICEKLIPLKTVFSLLAEDPNYMPVTRDLSGSKRKAILTWLTKLQDGKPLKTLPDDVGDPLTGTRARKTRAATAGAGPSRSR